MAQQSRQIKRTAQFPDTPREMSRLRDVQHRGARCEKGIIGRPRREWVNNIKLIL